MEWKIKFNWPFKIKQIVLLIFNAVGSALRIEVFISSSHQEWTSKRNIKYVNAVTLDLMRVVQNSKSLLARKIQALHF